MYLAVAKRFIFFVVDLGICPNMCLRYQGEGFVSVGLGGRGGLCAWRGCGGDALGLVLEVWMGNCVARNISHLLIGSMDGVVIIEH